MTRKSEVCSRCGALQIVCTCEGGPVDPVAATALRAYAGQLPVVLSVPNLAQALRGAAEEIEGAALMRDALIRIGGLDARGFEGFHNVGDEQGSETCPGCWAWWGLFGTVKPTQEQLDTLRAVEGIKGHAV